VYAFAMFLIFRFDAKGVGAMHLLWGAWGVLLQIVPTLTRLLGWGMFVCYKWCRRYAPFLIWDVCLL